MYEGCCTWPRFWSPTKKPVLLSRKAAGSNCTVRKELRLRSGFVCQVQSRVSADLFLASPSSSCCQKQKMMQVRKRCSAMAANVLRSQALISHSPSRWLGRITCWIGPPPCGGGSLRAMAHITGHKKTTKKNKKKRAAVFKKSNKKSAGMRPSKGAKPKAPFFETPLPADYPLGPNYQGSPNADNNKGEDVPPLMMKATGSRWAYVASAACEESGVRPELLFRGHDGESTTEFRQSMFSSTGSFVYFPPRSFNYEYPKDTTQFEVAFIGRSNVGKSSLVNAIMGANLAVTSKQPGRTQQPYYYGWVKDSIDRRELEASMASAFIVDLPGYGFAVGPDNAVDSWQQTTQEYLVARREAGALRRVFVLQDSRLGLPQSIDDSVCSWLENEGIPYSVVLTKADSPLLAVKHANMLCLKYMQLSMDDQSDVCYMSPMIHITSAKKGTGLVELLSTIASELKRS